MSVTTIKLAGKKSSKDGAELAWKINARHLDAANYPGGTYANVPGSKKGETKSVLQVSLLPSNVTAQEFGTREDVESVAGANFDSWVVRAANKLSREAAEAGARAYAEGIESYNGETLSFDGASINIFAPPAERVAESKAPGTVKGQLNSIVSSAGDLTELSDADRLKALEAMFAEIRKVAAK